MNWCKDCVNKEHCSDCMAGLDSMDAPTNYNDTKKDNINPSHYRNGKVECIDALESATVNKKGIEAICTANVIKYLWRYEDKNGFEDVKKAQWYLNRLIQSIDKRTPIEKYRELFVVHMSLEEEMSKLREVINDEENTASAETKLR